MFKPMLAVNIKPEEVQHDMMESPKLEGVRGVFRQGPLLTRSLKQFANPRLQEKFQAVSEFCNFHNIVLEGEFYLHGWTFKEIDSACRNANKEEASELQFHIFDMVIPNHPDLEFEQRCKYMEWCHKELSDAGVKDVFLIPQSKLIADANIGQAIRCKYAEYVDNGLEGIVLKRADGAYKFGRSTLKQELFTRVKPEDPFDGVVIDIIERQHNLCESEVNELGMLKKRQDKDQKAGAGIAQTAIVMSRDHGKLIRVSLTRGLKDYEETDNGSSRQYIWENRHSYVGKGIRFVGVPVAGMDVPRSPRFDAFREDLDPIFWSHAESGSWGVVFDGTDFDDLLEKDPLVEPTNFDEILAAYAHNEL